MRSHLRSVSAVVAAAALLLSACSSSNPDAEGSAGDTGESSIVIGAGSEPETLNPILGYGQDGAAKLFDGLVSRDEDLELTPALAEELPEVTGDGRTVTFQLREGVTFHDGTPLTAADVAFTYERILDPSVDTTLRSDLDALASVESQGDRTVVFRLKYPYAPFVQRTTLGIVPRKLLEGQDLATTGFNTRPVGTGPFKLESWTPGDRMVMTANPGYWGGEPAIDRVTIAFSEDDNVRATRLASGELDAAVLPPKAAERFRGEDGMKVYEVPSADYRGVMLPFEHPVTGELAVRKALNLAIDRQAMVDGILAGTGRPAFGPVAPSTQWYDKEVEGNSGADREQAEQVLEQAGWKPGAGGVRAKDGLPARFTLMYPSGDSLRKDLALAVASDARQVGLEVEVAGLDWDAIEPRMQSDALIMGWGTPYDPDFTNYQLFHSSFAGQGFFNPGRYRNAEVDGLLDRARQTGDEGDRKELYGDLQTRIADDAVWAYLVYLDHVYVVRDRFDGIKQQVEPHDHGLLHGPWWNIEKWRPRSQA